MFLSKMGSITSYGFFSDLQKFCLNSLQHFLEEPNKLTTKKKIGWLSLVYRKKHHTWLTLLSLSHSHTSYISLHCGLRLLSTWRDVNVCVPTLSTAYGSDLPAITPFMKLSLAAKFSASTKWIRTMPCGKKDGAHNSDGKRENRNVITRLLLKSKRPCFINTHISVHKLIKFHVRIYGAVLKMLY